MSDISSIMAMMQLLGGQKAPSMGQKMSQAYNPAAEYMPNMPTQSLLGKKSETPTPEQPYMWGGQPKPQTSGGLLGKGGGMGAGS